MYIQVYGEDGLLWIYYRGELWCYRDGEWQEYKAVSNADKGQSRGQRAGQTKDAAL